MERVWRSVGLVVLSLACASAAFADDVVYTYDAQGRLISVVYAGKAKVDYVYDAAGNRIERATGSAPSNSAPSAANDSVSVTVNSSVTFAPQDNDTDPLPLRVKSAGAASHGTVTILQSGARVRYTPVADYTGPDSFTYTIADFYGATASATVEVTVNGAGTAGESATGITYLASSNYGGFTGLRPPTACATAWPARRRPRTPPCLEGAPGSGPTWAAPSPSPRSRCWPTA